MKKHINLIFTIIFLIIATVLIILSMRNEMSALSYASFLLSAFSFFIVIYSKIKESYLPFCYEITSNYYLHNTRYITLKINNYGNETNVLKFEVKESVLRLVSRNYIKIDSQSSKIVKLIVLNDFKKTKIKIFDITKNEYMNIHIVKTSSKDTQTEVFKVRHGK